MWDGGTTIGLISIDVNNHVLDELPQLCRQQLEVPVNDEFRISYVTVHGRILLYNYCSSDCAHLFTTQLQEIPYCTWGSTGQATGKVFTLKCEGLLSATTLARFLLNHRP